MAVEPAPQAAESSVGGCDETHSTSLLLIRFRLFDGDLGPLAFSPTATVLSVKQRVLESWPKARLLPNAHPRPSRPLTLPREQDRAVPGGTGALKLILAGRLLTDELLLSEVSSSLPAIAPPWTMHLVVAPATARLPQACIVRRLTPCYAGEQGGLRGSSKVLRAAVRRYYYLTTQL
jgi:hypothetical protein